MRKRVLYKIFTGSLFSLFAVMPATVLAEDVPYRNVWNYSQPPNYAQPPMKPSMNPSIRPESTNPWHLSDKQKQESKFWSSSDQRVRQYQGQDMRHFDSQAQYYQSPPELVPDREIYEDQVWTNSQTENNTRERYVTQDIIDRLNRQEAHYNSRLNNVGGQYYQNRQTPSHEQEFERYGQGYPASPSYGMGSVNPAYDVPAVSPWGETPDVLQGVEEFPWMPNEAIGGVPPIYVPPFVGSTSPDNPKSSAGQKGSEVFNPYTFLQNEN